MPDDAELLRRYSAENAEEAFAELVRRHLNLVYGVALRQVGGNAQLAEDVAQQVFSDLARKARALSHHGVLGGWLYRSTQFAASNVVRVERRRRAREQEAQLMQENTRDVAVVVDWEKLRPVLDEAVGELSDRDRDAVVLRFFEGRAFAEVGAALRLSEDAARMRVERALEKMRAFLARRGVTSTGAALGLVLADYAGAAAPAGLAATVTTAAFTGSGTVLTSTAAGVAGTMATFMTMTKIQIGLAGTLVAAGTAAFVAQRESAGTLRREIDAWRRPNSALVSIRADNERMVRMAAEVEELHRDDGELVRLRDEVDALRKKLQTSVPAAAGNRGPNLARGPDRPTRPIAQATAAYPAELWASGISGEVQVDFIVDTNGTVQNAFAVKSTRREFEGPSLEAAKQWKFESGVIGGRPVNTHMLVPIVFTAGKERGEPGAPLPLPAPPPPPNWF